MGRACRPGAPRGADRLDVIAARPAGAPYRGADPPARVTRSRPRIAAILEKLAFGVAAVVLYLQGRLAPVVLAFGAIDLVLAALFALSYRATAGTEPQRAS